MFTCEKSPPAEADGLYRKRLQVLVAVDLVVVLEQDALHDGGELHVQIPEVDNKRDRKCAQCTERHAQQGLEQRRIYARQDFVRNGKGLLMFDLLSDYQDFSSFRISRLGSTGSSCMTVRI